MNYLKSDEKILEICYRPRYDTPFKEGNPYYYIVNDSFEASENDLVIIEPNISNEDRCNLQLGLVLSVLKPEKQIDDKTYLMNDSAYDYQIKNARRPSYIASLDLTDYFEAKKRMIRRVELEKTMNEAAKRLEKAAKYKALADLDPSLKAMYDEYISLTAKDILLEDGKSEEK